MIQSNNLKIGAVYIVVIFATNKLPFPVGVSDNYFHVSLSHEYVWTYNCSCFGGINVLNHGDGGVHSVPRYFEPLLRLHDGQDSSRFSGTVAPPFEYGTTWSA